MKLSQLDGVRNKHILVNLDLLDSLNTYLKCKDTTDFESEDLRRGPWTLSYDIKNICLYL